MAFKHGYLESPAISTSTIITGDLYELKVDYQVGNLPCFFDVNIATGDNTLNGGADISSTNNRIAHNYTCMNKIKGESVFSTFNRAIKTYPFGNSNTTTYVNSYFFQMPSLSYKHGNMYLQIGASNADIDVSIAPGTAAGTVGSGGTPNLSSVYYPYTTNDISTTLGLFRSGDPMPNNFGLGVPWKMLRNLYSAVNIMLPTNANVKWWNSSVNESGAAFPNNACPPSASFTSCATMADNTTGVRNVKLVRWAKKPYVLANVTYSVLKEDGLWTNVQKVALNYEIANTLNYAHGYLPSKLEQTTTTKSQQRSVILLKSIQQVEATNGTAISTLAEINKPTTTFCYVNKIFSNTQSAAYPNVACSNFFLSEINTALGQRTIIDYTDLIGTQVKNDGLTPFNTPQSYSITNYQANFRPSEFTIDPIFDPCANNISGQVPVHLSRSFSKQIFMVVKSKSVEDRNNTQRIFTYTFENPKYNATDRTPLDTKLTFDYIDNATTIGFETAEVKEGTISNTNTTPTTVYDGAVTGYTHSIDARLWGQLLAVTQYTTNKAKTTSKKEWTYSALKTFSPPSTFPTHPDFPKSFGTFNYDAPYFYESRIGSIPFTVSSTLLQQDYLCSFFIKLDKEKTTTYESDGTTLPVAIESVTEYEYYAKGSDNKPTSFAAYNALLNVSTYTATSTITSEPSWQRYKTKSYTTNAPDIFTQTEYFYLYDLSTGSVVFPNLTLAKNNKIRNLPFEVRTTTALSDNNTVKKVQSSYYEYSSTFPGLASKLLLSQTLVQAVAPTNTDISSFAATGVRTYPTKALLTSKVNAYATINLMPTEAEDVTGFKTKNVYNATNGNLNSTTIGAYQTNELTTTYSYNTTNNLVAKITDPNAIVIDLTYDVLNRLNSKKRNAVLLEEYEYSLFNIRSCNGLPTAQSNEHSTGTALVATNTCGSYCYSFESRAALNFVKVTTYVDGTTDKFIAYKYVDPLGRATGTTQEYAGTYYVKENTIYDTWSRPIRSNKPIAGSLPVINPTSTLFNDYSEVVYEVLPQSRPLKASKYGQNVNEATNTRLVFSGYSVKPKSDVINPSAVLGFTGNTIPRNLGTLFFMTQTTDEDGKTAKSYNNFLGQKVFETFGTATEATGTTYYYDAAGNIEKVLNPPQKVVQYYYNYLNQLYRKDTPDDGSTYYAYDEVGNLLADKNSKGEVRLFQYDLFRRMTAQYYLSTTPSTDLFANNGMLWFSAATTLSTNAYQVALALNTKVKEKEWFYDAPNSSALFSTPITGGGFHSTTKTKGKLAQSTTYNLAGVETQYHLYSYNTDGFLAWEITQFHQDGITSANKDASKTVKIDYPSYNTLGAYKSQQIDLDVATTATKDFLIGYGYDKWNRLVSLSAGYDAATFKNYVAYTYDNLYGYRTKKTFKDNTATCADAIIDNILYTYDTRFRLKSIVSTSFDENLFYDQDNPTIGGTTTTSSTNYNGNINAVTYDYNKGNTLGTSLSKFIAGTVYNYKYNALNRLINADAKIGMDNAFSTLTPNQLLYGDETFSYDPTGNILTTSSFQLLTPTAATFTQHSYTYNYTNGNSNLLNSVNVVKGTAASVLDRTLTYDAAGNTLTDSKRLYSSATYRPSHLVWKHPVGGATPYEVGYLYSVDDQRIYKEKKEGTTLKSREYYLRTAFGQELAVCDMTTTTTWTWYLTGAEREAKIVHTPTIVATTPASPILLPQRMKATEDDALDFPTRLYRIREKNTNTEAYLLQSEKDTLPLGYQILQDIPLYLAQQNVWVQRGGIDLGWKTLSEVLALRKEASNDLILNGYDPTCAEAKDIALAVPLPPRPSYYIYDHLGNTRVVYKSNLTTCATPKLTLEYLADYSPYGKVLRELIATGKAEKYLTTQHERDLETGLDYRDARYYDADLARFLTLDPLDEKYMGYSPYNYVIGNPIMLVDPDGRSAVPTIDKENKLVTINATLNFYGSGATNERAAEIAASVQKDWNGANGTVEIDGETYKVAFNVKGQTISRLGAALGKIFGGAENNYISLVEGNGISETGMLGGNTGNWLWANNKVDNKEYSHEFGHLLGWYDRTQFKTAEYGSHDYIGYSSSNIPGGGNALGIMTPSNAVRFSRNIGSNFSSLYFDNDQKPITLARTVTSNDINRIGINSISPGTPITPQNLKNNPRYTIPGPTKMSLIK